jgi:DNA-binding NarL/FixJ family response regulator
VINYQLVIPATVIMVMAVWTRALHVRQQRRIEALEGRVANLLAGLSILTDTTETGLRDVTAEVARLTGSSARPRSRATTHRRIAGAVKRGQSVQAIAAAEQISEGEVKLRLSMNGAQEGSDAEVR